MNKVITIGTDYIEHNNAASVKSASYCGEYQLRITFDDGKINTVDFSNFILYNKKPYLDKYKNTNKFKRFRIENGNVVWGKDWDLIFPVSQLYAGFIEPLE